MSRYNADLKTGDILLYRSRGVVGRLITLFTGGAFSHAGLAIVDGGRRYVLDARAPVCDVRPVSVDVRAGDSIRVMRLPADIAWDAASLADFAYEVEGYAPYGVAKLLANAWTAMFGVPDGLLDPCGVPRRFICSELVSRCCRMFAGVDPCVERPDRYTTPRDLSESPCLWTVTERLELEAAA